MKKGIFGIIAILSFIFASCEEGTSSSETNVWQVELPSHFKTLPAPEKNPMNAAKVELGARLFYDNRLSKDSSVSCSSCHFPSLAFSDGRTKSIGIGDSISVRNSPVMVNLAYATSYMMDGGVPTLELQVVAPLLHEGEMGFDLFELAERIGGDKRYQDLSKTAFNRKLDGAAIAYSIAAFERSLLSYESKYDYYLEGDKSVFSQQEMKGMELFFSDSLNCSACHSGANFSDYNFYNIGLYENYKDPGRWRVTEQDVDKGKFKTPTLRNIEYSPPYMHDGSIGSLEDVIRFKMSGGVSNKNKSDNFKSFQLDEEGRDALLAFLKTLSDPSFIKREMERKSEL